MLIRGYEKIWIRFLFSNASSISLHISFFLSNQGEEFLGELSNPNFQIQFLIFFFSLLFSFSFDWRTFLEWGLNQLFPIFFFIFLFPFLQLSSFLHLLYCSMSVVNQWNENELSALLLTQESICLEISWRI